MRPHELLARTTQVFDSLGIPYLITGSMASMAYREPRMTLDIDFVADPCLCGSGKKYKKCCLREVPRSGG